MPSLSRQSSFAYLLAPLCKVASFSKAKAPLPSISLTWQARQRWHTPPLISMKAVHLHLLAVRWPLGLLASSALGLLASVPLCLCASVPLCLCASWPLGPWPLCLCASRPAATPHLPQATCHLPLPTGHRPLPHCPLPHLPLATCHWPLATALELEPQLCNG